MAKEDRSLIGEIDQLTALGKKAEPEMVESIVSQIEKDPSVIAPLLRVRRVASARLIMLTKVEKT